MKKLAFILFVFVLSSVAFGQEDKFTLSGRITDCRTHDLIKGVTIKLVGSDGSSTETITDSLGYYFFDSKKIKANRQYIATTQVSNSTYSVTNLKTKKWGYLNSADKYKFSTYDSVSIKKIKNDFCLFKNVVCRMPLPLLHFEKNSITNYYFEDSLNDFSVLYQIMIDNPTFVIEIGGHASMDEKTPEYLSKNRAEEVKKILIKKGIEADRLLVKAYSNLTPYEYFDEDKLETITVDKTLYDKNRRVSFNIVRKDFISKNPIKEKTAPIPNEE